MKRRAVYLHGFASGPNSRKARFFREKVEALGWAVEVPDLAEGNFECLTFSGQLAVIERTLRDTEAPVTLIGSSMGGYLAALYAGRNPLSVERLVLLAPAFGFAQRWPELLGQEKLEAWKRTGVISVFHYADMRMRRLGYRIYEDSLGLDAYPAFSQPGIIFQGLNDTVVPPEYAREYTRRYPRVALEWMDSDHELVNALPAIWDKTKPFLDQ